METDWDRLGRFLNGVAASAELYSKAAKNGYFIEAVCLASNLIDAQLRIGLILRQQIKTKSKTIHKALLFQGEQDKPISEREIYKRALAEGVINQGLYSNLDELYTDRNKVIHRYIVSDLRTEGVLEIGIRYEKMQTAVRDAIFAIEEEQIRLGVGMTVKGPTFEGAGAIDWLAEMSMEKHGKKWL
jgi:hypothetical protein